MSMPRVRSRKLFVLGPLAAVALVVPAVAAAAGDPGASTSQSKCAQARVSGGGGSAAHSSCAAGAPAATSSGSTFDADTDAAADSRLRAGGLNQPGDPAAPGHPRPGTTAAGSASLSAHPDTDGADRTSATPGGAEGDAPTGDGLANEEDDGLADEEDDGLADEEDDGPPAGEADNGSSHDDHDRDRVDSRRPLTGGGGSSIDVTAGVGLGLG